MAVNFSGGDTLKPEDGLSYYLHKTEIVNMIIRSILIVVGCAFFAGVQAAEINESKPAFCKTYLIMPEGIDLPDDQLDEQLARSQQAVSQLYRELERSMPVKAENNVKQTPRLTKKDLRSQYRAWLAYQNQYCGNKVKRYDLQRNAENHAWAVCMLNLNQMQLCVMNDF